MANQLRAHLQINLPAAVGLFSDLDGHTSRNFLRRFQTEDDLGWLSEKRLSDWLRSIGCNDKCSAADLLDHIERAPAGTDGPGAAARSTVAIAYLDVIETLVEDPRARGPDQGAARPPRSATSCAASPATPDVTTNGQPIATSSSAPTGNGTPTPNASSPAPGPRSSGDAGKTTSPTNPTATAPSRPSEQHPLDIGLLT